MTRTRAISAVLLVALMAVLFGGVAGIPFHPDESSLLYESRDLELYLSDPDAMVWTEAGREDKVQQYRALNAPLAKYLLGIGRALAGQDANTVEVDWDWSQSWDQNQASGALPPLEVLLPARLASTVMVAASLLLIFLPGRDLGGAATGLVSVGLLGLNALVLLHGRRAMSEGTLTFAVALALWGILQGDRKPWLAGAATALAFSAKHSALALIPIGLLGVLWKSEPSAVPSSRRRLTVGVGMFLITLLAVVMMMNPLLWSDPLRSGVEILRARQELVREQVQALAELSPVQLPMSGTDKVSALIAQVFLTPVQFEEIPNYASELAPSIQTYLNNPLHRLLRGWFAGTLLMGLTLSGMLLGLSRMRHAEGPERRAIGLLVLSTLAQSGLLLLTLPFPFQRYYLPLVPLYTLWASYAVVQFTALIKRLPFRRAAFA